MNTLNDVFGCDSSVSSFTPSGITPSSITDQVPLATALSGLSSIVVASQANIDSLRNKIKTIKDEPGLPKELSSETFTKEYGNMLEQSKSMISIVTYMLSGSTTVLPETVTAAASLITAIRSLLADMMELYRDYTKFMYSIQLARVKSDLKKEEQAHKAQLEKELINLQNGVIEGDTDGFMEYRQSDIIEKLHRQDKDQYNGCPTPTTPGS